MTVAEKLERIDANTPRVYRAGRETELGKLKQTLEDDGVFVGEGLPDSYGAIATNAYLRAVSQWQMDTQTGTALHFEACKGGYFSTDEEYGLKVVGKTGQNTLTGKNLINDAAKFYSGGIVYVGANGKDMWLHLKAGQPYTFTVSATKIPSGIYARSESDSFLAYNKNILSFTPTVDGLFCFYVFDTTFTTADFLISAQLEMGSASTAYEPYCGGTYSPNPDYPQEIRCVKQGTKVMCVGKNLFDMQAALPYGAGSVTISGHILSYTGAYFVELPVSLKKDTAYTLSLVSDSFHYWAYRYTDGTYSTGAQNTLSDRTDATKTVKSVVLYKTDAATVGTVSFTNIQLEEARAATAYEPYYPPCEITVPTDLYEGDVWYPMSGKVEKWNGIITGFRFTTPTVTSYGKRVHYWTLDVQIGHEFAWCTHAKRSRWRWDEDAVTEVLMMSNPSSAIVSLAIPNTSPLIDFDDAQLNQFFEQQGAVLVYKKQTPSMEQYDPQPVIAPRGTVDLSQDATDLPAELSATVLMTKGGGEI